jgi:hypothetical protein
MYNYIELFKHLKAFNDTYKNNYKNYKHPSKSMKKLLNIIESLETPKQPSGKMARVESSFSKTNIKVI